MDTLMKEMLSNIKTAAEKEIAEIRADSADAAALLETLRGKYRGKKGELTVVLCGMGKLSPEERPVIGQIANEVREFIGKNLDKAKEQLQKKQLELQLKKEVIDVTMPGNSLRACNVHPLAQVLDEIKDIFIGLGFEIAEGPEVELDYYNFEALNIPKNHPARDTQDTFYINDNVVLRTQTCLLYTARCV